MNLVGIRRKIFTHFELFSFYSRFTQNRHYILCSSLCLCRSCAKHLTHETQLPRRCLAVSRSRGDVNKTISTSVEIHLNLYQYQKTSIPIVEISDLVASRLTQLKLIIMWSRNLKVKRRMQGKLGKQVSKELPPLIVDCLKLSISITRK